jgi:serine/threonine protein kinase
MTERVLSDPTRLPLKIDGYRILRRLGQGGMATVYLAVQESVDREVALKIMSPELSRSDKTYGERFLREARIVAKLIDPHIVTVYDVGVSNGLHYLAMEYVPGSDLRAHRMAMTLKQCLLAVKQTAQALEHAHHQGYVHRDIKPENILIHRHNGRAVLTDFGIARPVGSQDDHNAQGGALGTPSFMSPEQALGQPLDHRSDLYSLGIVVFYLLTGQVPFTGDSPVVVSMKHALDAIPRLPPALVRAQPLIDQALAKHPDQRFQSGHQFAQAVDQLMQQLTETEQQFWSVSLHADASTPEATRLSAGESTCVPATAWAAVDVSPLTAVMTTEPTKKTATELATSVATGVVATLQSFGRSAAKILLMIGQRLWIWAGIAGHFLWTQLRIVLPILKRGGERWVAAGQQFWANRSSHPAPQWLPAVAVAVVIGLFIWWLLSDDWNTTSAKRAYRDGDLSKAEYNEILQDLKAAHQERLDELRRALQEQDLTREEYIEAVREAKQEYTGQDDCGSLFGC